MFITNEIEFDAGIEQLAKYPLIENPTIEQKQWYSELSVHLELFIATQPTEQETMH